MDTNPPIGRLTPLAEILAAIARVAPVAACDLAVTQAAGAILAADAVAAGAIPPTDLALRDGWAVKAEATRDAGPYSPMPLDPQRIDAFAPMPPGTDAVAPPDAVSIIGGKAQIMEPVAAGEAVLPKATDAAPGDPVLKAGARLRAADIAVLRIAGIETVRARRPRLCVVDAKAGWLTPLAEFVARVAEAAGARVTMLGGDLEAILRESEADAVIGIGGTGGGTRDRSVVVLSRAGKVLCHGIGLLPGETAAFGEANGRPVLLLPGRLDAAMAVWLVLGQALLARLSGDEIEPWTQPVKLARKIASAVGIAQFVPLRRTQAGVLPLSSGIISLRHLAQADGWMLVPAESEGYPAGTSVQMRPLP